MTGPQAAKTWRQLACGGCPATRSSRRRRTTRSSCPVISCTGGFDVRRTEKPYLQAYLQTGQFLVDAGTADLGAVGGEIAPARRHHVHQEGNGRWLLRLTGRPPTRRGAAPDERPRCRGRGRLGWQDLPPGRPEDGGAGRGGPTGPARRADLLARAHPAAASRRCCGSSPARWRPTRAPSRWGGRPVTGPAPDRGMLFQTPMLFGWLTTRNNILFGPRASGPPGSTSATTPNSTRRPPRRWNGSAWAGSATRSRTNCRAACSTGRRSPARWRPGRRCC